MSNQNTKLSKLEILSSVSIITFMTSILALMIIPGLGKAIANAIIAAKNILASIATPAIAKLASIINLAPSYFALLGSKISLGLGFIGAKLLSVAGIHSLSSTVAVAIGAGALIAGLLLIAAVITTTVLLIKHASPKNQNTIKSPTPLIPSDKAAELVIAPQEPEPDASIKKEIDLEYSSALINTICMPMYLMCIMTVAYAQQQQAASHKGVLNPLLSASEGNDKEKVLTDWTQMSGLAPAM